MEIRLHAPGRAYLMAAFFLLFTSTVFAQTIRYVREGGAGTKDGLSWANASGNLQAMIDASQNGDKVWVAAGIYIPPSGSPYGPGSPFTGKDQGGFKMKNEVEIYGGFPATGNPGMPDRDWLNNNTILSGNSLRAVVSNLFSGYVALNRTAVLDGFTVSNGFASRGGGIKNQNASPTLKNLRIIKNTSDWGAAIYNDSQSSPAIINTIIHNNNALYYAAALINATGGAELTNVVISGNTAGSSSGASVIRASDNSTITLTNVTISGNTSPSSGTEGFMSSLINSTINVRNSIVYGNNEGQLPYTDGISAINVSYSLVQGITSTANNNINASTNPLFKDPASANYSLRLGSPVINAGNNAFFDAGQNPDLSAYDTDVIGNTRKFGGTIDMGAYESIETETEDSPIPDLPPMVVSTSVAGITTTDAILNGIVDGNGVATDVSFDYGTDPELAGATNITATTGGNIAAEAGSTAVSLNLNGLAIGTTYYFRIKSESSVGTTLGPIQSFNTLKISQTITFAALPARTYGDASFTLSATGGDSGNPVVFTSLNPSVATISGNTVTIVGAGTSTITASQVGNDTYYDATNVQQNLTIDKKTIAVTAEAKNKTYGDDDPELTYTFSPSLVVGDSFSGALSRDAGGDAGTYPINKGSLSLSDNYMLNYIGADFIIDQKTIDVTAEAKSKTYGADDPELTYTFSPSLVSGDSFSGALSRDGGEDVGTYTINRGDLALSTNYVLNYTGTKVLTIDQKTIDVTAEAKNKTYGADDPELTYTFSPSLVSGDSFSGALSRDGGEDVGTYTINRGDLALSTNYVLNYTGTKVLTIGQKTIDVTAEAKSKTYGDDDPELTYTFSPSLVSGDSFSGALSRDGGEDVGTYTINRGDLTLSGNYILNYTGTKVLTIDQKTIDVTAEAKSKTYGDDDPELTYTFSPSLVSGDSFSGALSRDGGEDVGTYTINRGDLALSTNYVLNYTGTKVLIIDQKTIDVTAEAKSKTYGDDDPELTYTFSPSLVSGDSFSGALSRDGGEDVGTYTINRGDLALSTNYVLNYTGTKVLIIDQKTIDVTAEAKSKTYGADDPELTYTFSPSLVSGDSFSGALSRDGGEDAGTYTINRGDLTLSGNYILNYTGTKVLTIDQKTIDVTAEAKSKTYGDDDPELTYTFSPSLVSGDSFSGALSRDGGEDVGTYTINRGDLALSTNYVLNYTGTKVLTIDQKTIEVTAEAKNKTYGDDDPELTYTFSPSLVVGDNFSGSLDRDGGEDTGTYTIRKGDLALSDNYVLNYTGSNLTIDQKTIEVTAEAKSKTYGADDPELTYTFSPSLVVGDNFSGSLDRDGGEDTGTYTIRKGDLALSDNYVLNYTGSNLTIDQKTIDVTAEAKSKTYGADDPELTYTFSPSLVVGDSFSGALSRDGGEDAGTYTISRGDLALSGNYVLNYTGSNLTIDQKTIDVTAEAKSKTYGDDDPELTYTFSPSLVVGDNFSGSLDRDGGEDAGTYTIRKGDLALSDNYVLNYTGSNLTIDQKTIDVTAEAKSKTYGDDDPELTYTFRPSLVSGDSFSGTLSRDGGEDAGSYPVNKGSLSLSSNYLLNFAPSALTINKKELIVTADDKTRFQGTENPGFTVRYSGFVNGEDEHILTAFPLAQTIATRTSPIGTYPITIGGGTSGNYAFTYVPGVLTVTPGAPNNIRLTYATVYENQPQHTLAGTFNSTSEDPDASFTYTLVDGSGNTDNTSFTITGNVLYTAAELDYEHKASYSIRVRSTTQHGLSLEQQFMINIEDVNEVPTLAAINDQVICYTTIEQAISLNDVSAGPESYQTTELTVNSTNTDLFDLLEVDNNILNYRIKPGQSGTALVTITIKDNGGIANGGTDTHSQSFTLTVNPNPVIAITTDKGISEISKGETLMLTASGRESYRWNNSPGIIDGQNTSSLTVRPSQTTTYRVMVNTAAGCTGSQDITVVVKEDYQVVKGTNILSPNGDGKNDRFIVQNLDMYPGNELKIFDRAGKVVYSKVNYANEWDGTFRGSPLTEGTYYYIIDFGATKGRIKGFITIVRD